MYICMLTSARIDMDTCARIPLETILQAKEKSHVFVLCVCVNNAYWIYALCHHCNGIKILQRYPSQSCE